MLEQVLTRAKTFLGDNLSTEIAKVNAFDAPAGMASLTLDVPAAANIHIYPVPDDLVFSKPAAIMYRGARTDVSQEFFKDQTKHVRHTVECAVYVCDQDKERVTQRLWRTAWAVEVVHRRYMMVPQNAGTNTGEVFDVKVTSVEWGGLRELEDGGFARVAVLTVEFHERVKYEYASI